VTVVDNFMYGQSSLLDCCQYDVFEVIRGDCRDQRIMAPLVSRADVIIPLAAVVGAPACNQDKVSAETTNLDAIKLLCSLASPDQWILFPTTNSGYGIGEKGKLCTEETPLRPISLYGRTKVEAEKVVLDRSNSISFRLATVCGMSQRMRIDLLVNDFVFRAVHDRALIIFEGHFKRNYIHVQDVAQVFLHALERFDGMKGRAYNVGLDDANLSKLELCAEIKKQIPSFVYIEAPIGEDPDKRDYIVSNARILSTGFVPQWSIARAIRELIKGFTIIRNSTYSNF
jgi:nucleoside-diphosphate-sugar epimerase